MPENSVYYYNDDHNEDYSADKPEAEEKNKKQHENDRSISQHKNDARDGAILTIVFVSLLAALLLGSVVYSLDRRNTMYNKVATLNNELELTKAEYVRLQSELDSKVSAKNVEDYAENVLGMQKIDSSQIKYIKIQTGDVVSIPAQEKGIAAKIKAFFDRCVEYFRG